MNLVLEKDYSLQFMHATRCYLRDNCRDNLTDMVRADLAFRCAPAPFLEIYNEIDAEVSDGMGDLFPPGVRDDWA